MESETERDDAIDQVRVGFEQLPGELLSADVAVNPRVRCAGVPQKLLNYMAAGKPIVSFEGSSWVLEHGKTGWLVEDHDLQGFAEGVLRLLDDRALAGSLGTAARELVTRQFSWDHAASAIDSSYRSFRSAG